MQKEAKARILINELLLRSGWRFFADEHGPANILLEAHVKLKKKTLDDLGDDFEKTADGFVDYLLLDGRGFPLAVLEAKSAKYEPLVGKEKARAYAHSQNVRFVLLSNGNLHYFWDLEQGNPTIITEFPRPESLGQFREFKPNPDALLAEKIEDDYVALTQNPGYRSDPRWRDEAQCAAFIKDTGLKFLRPYQIKAVEAIQNAVRRGQNRFLFEMATGTGKTLTAAAVIKLFVRTGNAKRVLFLVDRIELENQAKKAFDRNLKPDMTTVIYKQERDDWRKAEIVVSTVQSLQFNDKYRQLFSPTDFDLVISDEAHRSIGGNSRAVFEYFVGYKLGLTATPRDYLKHIDPAKLNDRDPRAWERRQLMDTYTTFGCESGVPTFRYSLVDGVRDKFLLNPIVVDARTDVTTELLSEKGYAVMVEGEDGELVEKAFASDDFEKKFFSDETNRVFCQAFLDHALRDPLSGEIGKSIIFCVRQKHALRIAQMLNEMAHERFPGRYQSDFAMQVTSNVDLAQQMAISFANNNLGGQTRWLDDYISARTRACVTVGMMTTGYDCEDLLNIVLLRPVFSPTDFIQIKGRGTRKYTFRHSVREGGQVEEHTAEKEAFKLFDFFANYEYFEEEYDYGQVQKLPLVRAGTPSPTPGPEPMPPVIDTYTYGGPDAPKTFSETPISPFGMKVDRMYFDRFSEQVKAQPQVRERYQRGDMQGAEEAVIANLFNKPEDFFDLTKLRKALQLDRRVTLAEILAHAFGDTPKIKTRAELVDDEVSKFVSIQKPDAAYVPVIRQFFGAYLTDEHIRGIIESGAYSKLADNPKLSQDDLRALGPWLKRIPEYVKDYVPLNTFMG